MRVATAQIGSVLFDTPATLLRVERVCRDAKAAGAELLVLPEALIGGYPKGLAFGAVVGSRSPAGKDLFVRYFQSAIACPGPESEGLCALARELDLHIVVGVVERDGGSLYCTGLLITPNRGLVLRHRKLMPTGTERLIWGQGDASDLHTAETRLGRVGIAICWENYMPRYRQHLYDQHVTLWCAPTVDARPLWQTSMRHIAYEGRCFVLSACQHLVAEDWPEDLRRPMGEDAVGVIAGGSVIVSPQGDVLAGPAAGESILYADLDLDDIPRGKFDLDVAGHSSRRDLFP